MARPVEQDSGTSGPKLAPEQVTQLANAFAGVASATTDVNAAQKIVNQNPNSAIAQQNLTASQQALDAAKKVSEANRLQVYENTGETVTPKPVVPVTEGLTAEQIAANNAAQLVKQQQEAQDAANFANRKSAYDLLFQQFSQYGLGSLVEPLKDLVQQNVSPSEFTLRLQATDAYKKRFSANADRISKGLSALNPAEYIAIEDQYQNIMRNYGLPSSYYAKDSMGTQAGFNQLLANDVSALELEDRITTGQSRVINASPEVKQALRQFYPDITDGDILAYVLNPDKALVDIKRKITASEIGGAAMAQGLTTSLDATGQSLGAEALTKLGVTQAEAQRGFSNIASILPTAEKLSSIYGGEDYTRLQAEQEQFKQLASAKRARESLTALETAQFGSSAGTNKSSLTSSTGQY